MADIYDSAFRTIVNDCEKFLLPLLNEIFGEHYTGAEEIVFHPNEHFISQEAEPSKKRITDTCFSVIATIIKKYHLECESSRYSNRMLIRIFEYDAQIALDQAELEKDVIVVTFPHTAVLYLRNKINTPDSLCVRMEVPGTFLEYQVPVVKIDTYTIDEIFEKKLYLLIPFFIFTHESSFRVYNKNEDELELLSQEYQDILNRLNELTEQGDITSFDKRTIIELTNQVVKALTEKFENVQRKVGGLMSGAMIQTEARRLRDEGIQLGEQRGRAEGIVRMSLKYNASEDIILTDLMTELQISREEALEYIKVYGKEPKGGTKNGSQFETQNVSACQIRERGRK